MKKRVLNFMLVSGFAVSSLLGVVATAGIGRAQSGTPAFDHLKCFKIKDSLKKAQYTLSLTPEQTEFVAQSGCVLKAPAKWLCIDVVKDQVQPPPPLQIGGKSARDYLCYTLKCPKAPVSFAVQDQFGQRTVAIGTSQFLCAPAQPETRCCHVVGGSINGACFDATTADATTICSFIGGGTSVLAPAGQMCDATTGACGSVKDTGGGCCECPVSQFPHPTYCFDAANPSQLQAICANPGSGCTFNLGLACGPATGTCGGL